MNKDIIILGIAWLLASGMLLLFVPKNKIRKAHVIFFFKQLLTWAIGLTVVEYKLIEYPIRVFEYASKTSFSFEYFIYPSICVIFNLHYPVKENFFRQFMYYVYFCTAMSVIEILLERYTNLIHYINWTWYLTWITEFVAFYISRKYYLWFFRLNEKS